MDSHDISLETLEEIISELRKNGKAFVDLNHMLKLYNSRIQENDNKNLNEGNSKKELLKTEQKTPTLTFEQTKKEITKKINDLSQSMEKNGMNSKIISFFSEEYIRIVMDKQINRKQRIDKLNELGNQIDICQQNLNEIAIHLYEIKQKIVNVDKMYTYTKRYIEIYQSNEIVDLKNKLNQILESININNPITLKQLSDISRKLDQILLTLNELYELAKYRKTDFFSRYKFEYNFNGIIFKVDTEEKTYEISYNERLIQILKEYKIKKLNKLLEERLKFTQFNEIIEPKYVNENKFIEFIKNNKLSLEEILKYNIEDLIKYLSLVPEINRIPTIEEISNENKDIKNAYTLLNILNSQGFETYIGKENILTEDIIKIYQSIDITSIKDIYSVITPIISSRYPDEVHVYSSLQNTYNVINPILRKKIHNDLQNNKQSKNLKQIIEFIKKYSRNKEGKTYSEDEILNFLKQKNEIVNTQYKLDTESIEEYKESSNVSDDMDKILYKLTGKRR